jgi:tetratricopeptide (TPR) repeat protein
VATSLAWAVALCLADPAGLGGHQQPSTTDRLVEARRLVDGGRAQEALDHLGDAWADDDPRAQLVRGLAYYHLGDAARAVELLDRARTGLTSDADREQATEVLGLALMLEGRAAQALPHLDATVKARQSPEVAHVLAQAAVLTSQPDTARRALALALGLDHDRPEAYVAAGQLMARLDMHEMAEAALREAVSRSASTPEAHYLLGQEALFRGRLEEAVALTRRELALNPLDAMALVQLGDALSRMGQWDEAMPVLQRAIWLNPYYSAPYILLGQGHLRARQPDLAEGMVRRAIAFDPNNRAAHYLLGQVLQQLGQSDAAKAAFTRAEQLQSQGRR